MTDNPIEQQLRTIIHNTMGKRGYYSRPLENDLADALETLFDTYATRKADEASAEVLTWVVDSFTRDDHSNYIDVHNAVIKRKIAELNHKEPNI